MWKYNLASGSFESSWLPFLSAGLRKSYLSMHFPSFSQGLGWQWLGPKTENKNNVLNNLQYIFLSFYSVLNTSESSRQFAFALRYGSTFHFDMPDSVVPLTKLLFTLFRQLDTFMKHSVSMSRLSSLSGQTTRS